MRKIIICRGIQGSGKSTWAKQWCHEDPQHRVRFNNDDIRNMFGDYWVPSRENMVSAMKLHFARTAMMNGYDIVVDNMNLNPKEIAWWQNEVDLFNEQPTALSEKYHIEYKDFWTPVDECIRRDALREHPIGEKVIKDTWRRYRDFIICENIKEMVKNQAKHINGANSAIIVDMDATLCLNTSGRPFYGDGSAEGMMDDMPVEGVCELVRCMHKKHHIFIITGREGTPETIVATKKWLEKHNIDVSRLYFRPVGDHSPGPECKRKLYEENIKGRYNIEFVLDDNSKCVKMWRDQGLICLQPNEGKF